MPTNQKKLDPKLEKWIAMGQEILRDAQELMIKTKLFDDYIEIVKANSEIQYPSDFHQWTIRNYYDSALMCIRRLVDEHKDARSLFNLMSDINCYHHLITRDFYTRNYQGGEDGFPGPVDYANDEFDALMDPQGVLDQKVVETDIETLKSQTEVVQHFIDNTLAHKNKGPKGKQTLETKVAREAISHIEQVVMKYLDILGYGGYSELTPVWQESPLRVFTKPWIRSQGSEV